jgi:hypothetical protein
MSFGNELPNESITQIRVNTKFKPQIEDGEDNKVETIRGFHNAVHYWIDKKITECEEFEQEILEIMSEAWELPEKVKEFSDLGEISIVITESQPVIIKQTNEIIEEIEDKTQQKLK